MELYEFIVTIVSIFVVYYALMIFNIILHFAFRIDGKNLYEKKLMIVFGSGGHTTEMLMMMKPLEFRLY